MPPEGWPEDIPRPAMPERPRAGTDLGEHITVRRNGLTVHIPMRQAGIVKGRRARSDQAAFEFEPGKWRVMTMRAALLLLLEKLPHAPTLKELEQCDPYWN